MAAALKLLYQWSPYIDSDSQEQQQQAGLWSVSSNGQDLDHLLVDGSTVKWYRGLCPDTRVLQAVYCVKSPILQVIWCWFSKDEQEQLPREERGGEGAEHVRCLAVREYRQLTLFMMNGMIHYIPLPFEVLSMWSIKGSLLIERSIRGGGAGGEAGLLSEDSLPVLFTISHPLDDVCPVTCRRPSFPNQSAGSSLLAYMTSSQLHVAAVCCNDHTHSPLIVTYDQRDNTHTVWTVKPATVEDIPTPASTPGPGGVMIYSARTPGPLSSSAPARYSHCSSLGTPIRFSLHVQPSPTVTIATDRRRSLLTSLHEDSLKRATFKRVQLQLQQRSPAIGSLPKSSRGAGLSSVTSSGAVSGRSPFVNRYITPHNQQERTKITKAKSLSPQLHHARISPYSQTVNAHSWSTFYQEGEESELGHLYQFLYPQICLHQLWTELPEEDIAMIYRGCTNAFVTEDFKGVELLALLIGSLNQLRLVSLLKVKMNDSNSLCDVSVVEGINQVINFRDHKMMLALTVTGTLCLYSGDQMVTELDMSPLYSSSAISEQDVTVKTIRDPIDSEFTLVTVQGICFQCSIPIQRQSNTAILLCLDALSSILPSQSASELMISYYKCSCSWNENEDAWNWFETWLLSCMGMSLLQSDPKEEPVSADTSDWCSLVTMCNTDPVLINDPVIQLLISTDLSSARRAVGGAISHDTVSLRQYSACITSALHLVYEEMKLNVHLMQYLPQLGSLLYTLTDHLGWLSYKDHYSRDTPSLLYHRRKPTERVWSNESNMTEDRPLYNQTTPPGIYQTLYNILQGRKASSYPVLGGVCKRSEQIMRIYSLLAAQYWNVLFSTSLYHMIEGTHSMDENHTPLINEPIGDKSYLEQLLDYLSQETDISASELCSFPVGVVLPIWSVLFDCRANPSSSWSLRTYQLIGCSDIGRTLYERRGTTLHYEQSVDEDDDGMTFNDEILKLRFSTDLRVKEVKRLLSSSKPVRIALEQKPEVSDHEFVEQQEAYLLSLCQRTMSLPVGRGMFTLATVHPLPTVPLKIPQLNLTGRVPPRNASVSLDHIDKPANMTEWPEFHNGVATGLKIAPGISKLDSTWIVFNQPSVAEADSGGGSVKGVNEYAGFLMALGLNSHLTSLSPYNTFSYLKEKHELIVIAILLGTAAARCGSMDMSTASLLSIYFPPLLPPGSADMEVSILMQTGAMLGLGLVYMGSCNRFMVQTMLEEIGHSPGPELEFATNRESYSLNAGLALGMIAIGAGSNAISLSGLNLVDQLCIYINGGLKRDVIAADTASTSHLVLEGSHINTHVTASGAILALGLVYLKSNDRQIAAHLTPPTTAYQLNCVRPDFLLLRALSHGLILWDDTVPTQDWIAGNIPQIVHLNAFKSTDSQTGLESSDSQTISQAYLYITAGCCMAIGLKYAGSCNSEAFECLLSQYQMILSAQSSSSEQISKYCIDTCVQTILLSLTAVMSGSGDLRLLKLIRRHHTQGGGAEVNYGHQMATHMSLGLLFLGGGRYCLNSSNKGIAALLCALYPHFPNSSIDNRYHLQALRHLYVLAAEPRVLVTRDCETDQSCSVPIQIHSQNNGIGTVTNTMSPCLLPDWDQIIEINIMGPRYWSVKYELLQENVKQCLMSTGTIYVRKHTGYSNYESDPLGQKSVLSLAVLSPTQYQLGGVIGKVNIPMETLEHNRYVKEFYHQLCVNGKEFYSAILLDCINKEQLELLNVYLQLEELCKEGTVPSASDVWSAKLCSAYSNISTLSHSLSDYIEGILMRLTCLLNRHTSVHGLVHSYISGHQLSFQSEREAKLLAISLALYDIPFLSEPVSDVTSLLMNEDTRGMSASAMVKSLLVLYSPFSQLTV